MRSATARLAALAAGSLLCLQAAAGDVVAVVSPKLRVGAVTVDQLADIYLGRSNRFPDGTPATPCDLAEGSALRDAFYAKVLGKSAAQMKAHWSKLIFTGRGQPPREVANSEEAKRLVAQNPGTVCYIDSVAVDSTVSVLQLR